LDVGRPKRNRGSFANLLPQSQFSPLSYSFRSRSEFPNRQGFTWPVLSGTWREKMHLAQFPEESGGPSEIFDFTKDGKTIVFRATNASGQFKPVIACDLETGKLLETLPKDEELHRVPSPQHSADGKRYVNDWKVFDVESGKVIAKLEAWKHPDSGGWRPWFQISADGSRCFPSRRVATNGRKTKRRAAPLGDPV
jgi:hypothetical protein